LGIRLVQKVDEAAEVGRGLVLRNADVGEFVEANGAGVDDVGPGGEEAGERRGVRVDLDSWRQGLPDPGSAARARQDRRDLLPKRHPPQASGVPPPLAGLALARAASRPRLAFRLLAIAVLWWKDEGIPSKYRVTSNILHYCLTTQPGTSEVIDRSGGGDRSEPQTPTNVGRSNPKRDATVERYKPKIFNSQAEMAKPVPPSSRTPITGVPIQRIWAEDSNY
ncbi:hypothetical protein THAOC_22296, partial [Thalassiosira oceanica]